MGRAPSTGPRRPKAATPERTCIGCRRTAGPAELVRVARRPDGSIGVGRSEPGRGAWLCAGSAACFETAVRRRAFARALRGEVASDVLDQLRGKLVIEVLPRVPEAAPVGAPGPAPSSL